MAKRILAGIVICLGIAVTIAWFEGLELGVEEIENAYEDPNLRSALTESTLGYLLIPYSLYEGTGAVVPIVAWAAGGFVAGLITKSPSKGLLVGILSVGIAWIVLSYLSGTLAGLSFRESLSALVHQARGMEKDLFTALIAVVIPSIIGGAITKKEKVEIIPMGK